MFWLFSESGFSLTFGLSFLGGAVHNIYVEKERKSLKNVKGSEVLRKKNRKEHFHKFSS